MKIFANKSVWKKIVIVFLLLTVFSFAAPKPVAAGIGGTLMEPICDFLVWAGDGLVNVTHRILIHQNDTLIKVDLNDGIIGIIRVIFTIIAAIGVLALICAGGWFAFDALLGLFHATWSMAAAAAFGSVIVLGVVSSIYVGAQVYSIDGWDNEVHIPLYSITPEEIFKGDIKLFNVDFFDSNDGETDPYTYDFTDMELGDLSYDLIQNNITPSEYNTYADQNGYPRKNLFFQDSQTTSDDNLTITIIYYCITSDDNGNQTIYKLVQTTVNEVVSTSISVVSDTYALYVASDDGSNGDIHSGVTYNYGYQLKDTVAIWYRRILVLAIVGMMSVLVYIGIRMTLVSVSSQKAKYKQMLGDWFVGMILLFSMHYIMVFSNLFVNKLTNVLKGVTPKIYFMYLEDKNNKIENALQSSRFVISTDLGQMGGAGGTGAARYVYKEVDEETDKSYLLMQTNLMGKLRYVM